VYCEGKSPEQVGRIAGLIAEVSQGSAGVARNPEGEGTAAVPSTPRAEGEAAVRSTREVKSELESTVTGPSSGTTLFTRARPEHLRAVLEELPDAFVDERAGLLAWPPTPPEPTGGLVVVASAGTSDQPVALEAAHTARFLGREVVSVDDVGIAGVHRTLARVDLLRSAAAIVVVAGMDGALPGLIAGLVPAPVIAVPTSVGYGAAFEGIAALLTMLNACAPGVAVVNIDNGYGAGHLAAQIARHAPPAQS